MICAFFSFESPDPLVVVDSEGQLVDEAAEVFEICFQVVSSGADRFVVTGVFRINLRQGDLFGTCLGGGYADRQAEVQTAARSAST